MDRREAYRIHLSWDGTRFVLYLRSLLTGVLSTPVGVWELPYLTKRTVLTLPAGRQEIVAYALGASELASGLLDLHRHHPLGRDAEWTRSLLRWIVSLYAAEAWYPEVHKEQISLRLLIDSVEAGHKVRQFREAMPPSFRAASPSTTPPGSLFQDVLETLGDAVGWWLLRQGAIGFRAGALKKLPPAYSSLLETLGGGSRQVSTPVTFFDPRQANLTLPERSSRLAFRIIPPGEDPLWQLRPQLQHLQDTDRSCDALLGWQDPETIPADFVTPGTGPRFHLLREFGRALRVFPDLGASLAFSPPAPLRYDDSQMAQFLKTQADPLRAYGYPLLAPDGLAQPHSPQVSLRIDPGGERQGLDIGQLLEFDWNLAVDETLLDLEDLQAWADNPSALLFSRGRWYWVDPKTTMKAFRFMQKQPPRGTLLEAMALAGGPQALRLEFAGQLSPLDQRQRFEERTEPEGFLGTLRHYQRRGFSWLLFMRRLGLGACLADDMGLGKTVQTLAALLALKNQGELEKGALLICPTSVLGNWKEEAARFTPDLRVMLHHGKRLKEPERFLEEIAGHDIVITSYPLLTRDRKNFLAPEWDAVILDEAQQIKNAQTQSSKVARELKTAGRIILTGTPVENRLEDLFSLFRFLQPELLESRRTFQTRFARPIENRGDTEAKEQLRRLVGPFILRRLKTDPTVAPELPSKLETIVACSLTPEQAKLYEAEVEAALGQLQGMQGIHRRGAILKLLTRLKQLCDHPALLETGDPDWSQARAGKLHRLYEILEELPEGEGILIFSQFSRMVRRLQSLLTRHLDEEVLAFDGSTPRHLRDQMVKRFQSGRGPRLFVISLKSGGVGLNLTRASTVVHYDRWWNPAVETQATDRAFRIGQDRNVQVFKFSTQGTLEEQIDRILAEKQSLVTGLIEEGDSWLTELDDNALAKLLRPAGGPA